LCLTTSDAKRSMGHAHVKSLENRDGNGCDLSAYSRIKKPVGHGFGCEPVPVDTDTGNI
jgi:hypothetical protein